MKQGEYEQWEIIRVVPEAIVSMVSAFFQDKRKKKVKDLNIGQVEKCL